MSQTERVVVVLQSGTRHATPSCTHTVRFLPECVFFLKKGEALCGTLNLPLPVVRFHHAAWPSPRTPPRSAQARRGSVGLHRSGGGVTCGPSTVMFRNRDLPGIGPSNWRDCHFADALSPLILKYLLKLAGVQQNGNLADGYRPHVGKILPDQTTCKTPGTGIFQPPAG